MTKQDSTQIVQLLSRYEPGFLPYPVFEQIARLVALPILEFIPLRIHEGKVQVLLISRGPNDPLWPNALHTPGTVIRADDLYVKDKAAWPAYDRIVNDELGGVSTSVPHYVGSLLHESKRGVEQAQLYWVELDTKPASGQYFDVEDLPAETMESQKKFISAAVVNYRTHKNL
jgi:hypothetical protein